MGDTNFQVIQTRKLTLENISGGNVAFKVKTTALKAYLVRPSNAVLLPGETKEVSIMLQKQTERPKNYDHRFLVQAYSTTDTEVSTKEAWVALQRSSRLQEFRLSVVFPDTPVLMANQGGGSSGGDAGGPGASGDLKGKYDELVTYVEKLERQKQVLEQEVRALRKQGESGGSKGWALWQVLAAIIFAVLAVTLGERAKNAAI